MEEVLVLEKSFTEFFHNVKVCAECVTVACSSSVRVRWFVCVCAHVRGFVDPLPTQFLSRSLRMHTGHHSRQGAVQQVGRQGEGLRRHVCCHQSRRARRTLRQHRYGKPCTHRQLSTLALLDFLNECCAVVTGDGNGPAASFGAGGK